MTTRKNGITRFGLRNFKAFHYLEDIERRPLTLLVGANSSGKSSIFQSLLLLKQSLLSSTGTGPLKFDGDWVKLGGFSQVVSNLDTSRDLEYRFTIRASGLPFTLLGPLLSKSDAPPVSGVTDVEGDITVTLSASCETTGPSEITTRIDTPEGAHDLLRLDERHITVGPNQFRVMPPRKLLFDSFLPGVAFYHLAALGQADSAASHVGFHQIIALSLREALSSSLDYLGPVRADPRPFYPVSENPWLGARGEGAVPFLLKHKADQVQHAPGPQDDIRTDELFDAVNHWLSRMRIVEGITIDPVESIAYTAAVRTPLVKSRPVNLSQVGFGVSQILPVLIQGLRNPSDAWILFEQPEIHLHPRLQGELGDFFLACARTGKTLMVETHSDHLVHRIRRRIAEDTTGELASLVQILFVHAGTEENPGSYIEPLRVGPDGSIENWPEDFLQDAADEAWAILRARQARHRQAPP